MEMLYTSLALCGEYPPIIGGCPSQRGSSVEFSAFLYYQSAQELLNIALRSQVWVRPGGGPAVFWMQSALLWVTVVSQL